MKHYTGLQTWTDSLEECMEWKMDTSFGTWNAKILCRLGSLKTISR
jgi:hypothetical protein